ncbi:MAG: hypothetical protein GQ527_07165, partial [Bacteroidales bacterium]|nr:hypothetical protein [Bacteroidales bacterium]
MKQSRLIFILLLLSQALMAQKTNWPSYRGNPSLTGTTEAEIASSLKL